MYSEDDSDSGTSEINSYAILSNRPYMRLYDQDEAEARTHWKWQRMKNRDNPRSEAMPHEDDPPLYKVYRILRFFKSYQGFYTGSLDLTGRHMPRYISFHTRWNSYLTDFLPLTLDAKETVMETTIGSEDLKMQISYKKHSFSDDTLWEKFKEKWRIPLGNIIEYSLLLSHTLEVLRTIKSNPLPHIQKLCLVDLPPELLDLIFEHSDMPEARVLSSTCKKLNEVGRRYIFRSRSLTFDIEHNFWKHLEDIEDVSSYMEELARSARIKILETTEFLLSRPDLCQKMTAVHMSNNWLPSVFEQTSSMGFDVSKIEAKFLAPVLRKFMRVLAISTNLVVVSFCGLSFSTRVVRHLAELPSLHTLTLRECLVTPNVFSGFGLDGVTLPIYNLRLWISAKTSPMWHILGLCPNLRTLSVLSPYKYNIPTPSTQVWSKCHFFPHLKHLSLNHIRASTIVDLANALWDVSLTSGLHITHFKIHTRQGVCDADIYTLLNAIQSAPIKVFVFEGLGEAEPALFSRITQSLGSTLIALTLFRRASDRQSCNREVIWPHPAWEYAQHLSGLTNLKHFGWNSVFQPVITSSAVFQKFELGFPDNTAEYVQEDDDDNEKPSIDARPFAAYCPNLETCSGYGSYTATLITRSDNGSISTELLDSASSTVRKKYDIAKWNPHTLLGKEWPFIVPDNINPTI